MMRLFFCIAVLCAFFVRNVFSGEENKVEEQVSELTPLEIEEEALENGLRVIVVHTNTKASIVCGVLYFVGFGDEPRNLVGISHFTEHMMFGGTTNLSSKGLKEIIEKYNKNSNAFTTNDITFYHHQCRKQFLDVNLKIEADRMQNLLLDEDYIERERKVIIEERKMRVEADPRQKYMYESAFKILYLYSTYSYPGIGYIDQIMACDKSAIEAHYKKFYTPNNAAVIIVGDITLKEAVEKVNKYFGSIKKRGENAKRDRIIDPKNTGLTYTMNHESEQIQMHDLDTIYHVNRDLIDSMKNILIVEMVSNLLAARGDSVLAQHLVDKKELAYVIGSYVDNRAFDKGRLSISMILRDGKYVKAADEEMTKVINDFADKYLTAELVEKEKIKMLDQIEMMKDDPDALMQLVVLNIGNGYNLLDIKNIKKIIKSITIDDVRSIAKEILQKQNRILQIYSHPTTAPRNDKFF
ncbi:MAG: insulinase family protein [Holosporales bacterium]|jgi:zinc protease|nr:insulinase family protein [Holosporales bacterium]